MAENLGDALLTLRTNSTELEKGLLDARRKAEQTMNALAVAQARATTENNAAKAAYKAGEITLEAYNKKLLENKAALAGVQSGHALAQKELGKFAQAGQAVTASAGAQRSGMQQLSFQLNDVATMYALGARPMQIFASQSGQVLQAVQLMTGGTSKLAAFLGGPWGLAITSAAIVLTPFIGKLFEGEAALQAVELASDAMGDAQSILGGVIDLTTGKIKNQTEALWANAAAKAGSARVTAQENQAKARAQLTDLGKSDANFVSGFFQMKPVTERGERNVVNDFVGGKLSARESTKKLDRLLDEGKVTQQGYLNASGAINNFNQETRNIKTYEDTLAALDGDQKALKRLGIGGGAKERSSRGGGGGRGGSGRTSAGPKGPSQTEIDARYEDQLRGYTSRILSARAQIATSAEERADLEMRQIEWARIAAKQDITAQEHISEVQRADLLAANERLADAERQVVEFGMQRELEGDAQAMLQERFNAQSEALQIQLSLADTEAERKELALKLLEAEEAFLRQRLMAVIFSETANDAERERAQVALDAVRATAAGRRAEVARANETTLDRYLRDLNKSPAQINEAVDAITMDGLDSLNEGLVDAVRGVKSLGDVFSSIADQIIADLLRIAIQQAIIKPIANALFPGGAGTGSGGGAGEILSAFAGFFATGGTIPTGQFGVVGENGPELAFASPGGLGILSNSDSRRAMSQAGGESGGTNVTIPITIDATGADAAAIARLNSRLDQMSADLPGRIVSTVQDGLERRIITGGRQR